MEIIYIFINTYIDNVNTMVFFEISATLSTLVVVLMGDLPHIAETEAEETAEKIQTCQTPHACLK